MPRALRTADAPARTGAPSSVVAGIALVVFATLLLAAGVAAVARVVDLERRHDAVASSAPGASDAAADPAAALLGLRDSLEPGERFALVFAPRLSKDDEGFYRLLAIADLYPAVAAGDPANAHALVVVGRPQADVLDEFAPVVVEHGLWLGRRR